MWVGCLSQKRGKGVCLCVVCVCVFSWGVSWHGGELALGHSDTSGVSQRVKEIGKSV